MPDLEKIDSKDLEVNAKLAKIAYSTISTAHRFTLRVQPNLDEEEQELMSQFPEKIARLQRQVFEMNVKFN